MVGSFDSIVLAAVAADLQGWLGGRVARVIQSAPLELAVELRAGGRRAAIVYSIHARWARVHLGAAGPEGPRSPFASMLRSRLDRARLAAVEQRAFERVLTLRFETDTGPADLVAEIMARHSNLILVQGGIISGALKPVPARLSSVREVLPGRPYRAPPAGRPSPAELTGDRWRAILEAPAEPLTRILTTRLLGISPTMARELAARAGLDPDRPVAPPAAQLLDALRWLAAVVQRHEFSPVVYLDGAAVAGYAAFPLRSATHLVAEPAPTMSEAVARVVTAQRAGSDLQEARARSVAAVQAALARVTRIEAEIRAGLEDARTGEAIKQRGELLLAYAAQIPAGATAATVPGYDGAPTTIPLDPTRTPVQNARAFFARYAKLRRALPALEARGRVLAQERAYLDAALAMVEQATDPADAAALADELRDEGYLRPARRARPPAAPWQPKAFPLPGGATVLVGRTNQDNDRITFRVAAPDDLWLHARGVPGAHVVLRTGGRAPEPAEIERAAAIAAWFSRARGATSVAVDYTARAHVRKPKGSRPGFVVYERERTVQVRPQAP